MSSGTSAANTSTRKLSSGLRSSSAIADEALVRELREQLERVRGDHVERRLELLAEHGSDVVDRAVSVRQIPDAPADVVEREVLARVGRQEQNRVACRLGEYAVATAWAAVPVHRLRYIAVHELRRDAMKVLYVERTGLVGGGERSLLGLLDGTAGRVDATLACPSGPLQAAAVSRDVPVVTIPETAGSLRLHPLHTPTGLATMASAAWAIRREARRLGVDLLHANSIRAGLISAPAARSLGLPLVVHIRDRLPPSALTSAV